MFLHRQAANQFLPLDQSEALRSLLSAWPVAHAADWIAEVNGVQTEGELTGLRRCVQRGQPFGEESWVARTVAALGLERTLRPRGRPKKKAQAARKGS